MAGIKKRKKNTRMHGRKMGSHGWGARKKRKKSGHRGGNGMSGSGKRADHKKTLVLKKYGSGYFGKQGITSRKTERDIRQRINLSQIEKNIQTYIFKGIAKKTSSGFEINLSTYKILGDGDVKNTFIISALDASKTAVEKIKKAGGEIRIKGKIDKAEKTENVK